MVKHLERYRFSGVSLKIIKNGTPNNWIRESIINHKPTESSLFFSNKWTNLNTRIVHAISDILAVYLNIGNNWTRYIKLMLIESRPMSFLSKK